MTTVKIFFTLPSGKEEIRRFTTNESNVFGSILKYLETTYVAKGFEPPLRFVVAYVDEDGDLITVSSEEEFQVGIQSHLASPQGKQVWKLMCRFDEEVSPLPEMSTLSIASTPSVTPSISHEFPPSPSRKEQVNDASVVPAKVVVEEPANTLEVESPPASPSNVIQEAHVVPEVSSDDEYVRIDENVPEPVDPTDQYIEERAADRFACRLCSKQFKARHFIVDHLNNRHSDKMKEAVAAAAAASVEVEPAETSMPVETTSTPAKVDEAPASAIEPSTEVNANAAPVEVAPSTPTTEPALAKAPIVDEASPKQSPPVEIADVTGHHQHVTPSPEPTVVASSSSAKPQVVHEHITCDGCGMSPIVGDRYHCTMCTMTGGFDLCSACEASGTKHISSHILLKMRVPASIPVGAFKRGCRVVQKPKAQFISDVTLADGLNVHAGEILKKVWSIKNIGSEPWPVGTRLVFAGGDLAPESEGVADRHGAIVPFAGPDDVVHVSIDIQVPNETGRFRGTFRLETPDRVRFGPRIWIDVTVPEESPAPVAAAPAVVATPKVEEKPVVAAPAAVVPPKVEEKKEAEASVVIPPKVEEKKVDEPKVESSSSVSAELPGFRQFVYSNELASLRSMGFTDLELCKYLLLNNQGDIQRVVAWLLNNTH